jgi:hypothetical protein
LILAWAGACVNGVIVMNGNSVLKVIGKTVLASDPYWGSYLGELVDCFKTSLGHRARVIISETIEMPSQCAIIYKDSFIRRQPYKSGRIVNFNLCNIQLYEIENREGVVSLEDTLKEIVAKALQAKLDYPVEVTQQEWEDARKEALNDVYANKFCFVANVSLDYFVEVMVTTIAIVKRIAA